MNWRLLGERAIETLIRVCGVSAIVFVFGIFVFVLKEGWEFLTHRLDLVQFFTSIEWRPTSPNDPTYGALALLAGTAAVTAVAMAIAVPFGLGTAVFVSEFCRPRTKEALKIVIELLAAIPSVVWGFIGITLMNVTVIAVTGAPVGVNVLNSGVILALMSMPIIVSIGEDALKAVPDHFREAAESLGATRWQVVYKVLFPAAKNGLLAAVLLGVGRAVGETMAVLMATGHSIRMVFDSEPPVLHVLSPARTLTATIAAELGEAPKGSDHYQALFVIGLLLFAITFAINLAADLIVRGIRKE
ncbi:MAG: phosphate ABC transporter permease subunit PstC [Planctomycetes bacterium]|nr:phosphate ABC transporter permease subunit PstC [Planctomycetota bacterium]